MTKILIDRSTVEQALKALKMMREKYGEYACPACDHADAAIDALRSRLAHCDRCGKKLGGPDHIHTCSPQVQEPVGYWEGKFSDDGGATLYEVPQQSIFGRKYRNEPLYASPPQRKPLTDEEIRQFWREATMKPKYTSELVEDFARAIEAAHGIKENT